jgi:hypothetical protein
MSSLKPISVNGWLWCVDFIEPKGPSGNKRLGSTDLWSRILDRSGNR